MIDKVKPSNAQLPQNSQEIQLAVAGGSKFGRYNKISAERTYNCFVSDGWLVNYPGWEKVLDLITGGMEGRGLFNSTRGGFMLAIINKVVFKVDGDLNVTNVGTLATNSGEVYIDENLNKQIAIVDGTNLYIYNWGNGGFNQQADGTLGGDLIPSYVCFHNGNFLIGNSNSTNWYVYIPDVNPANVKKVETVSMQVKPDNPLAVKRIPGRSDNVIAIGNNSCQIYNNVSNPSVQPNTTVTTYVPIKSMSSDLGTINISTIAANEEYIAWIGINELNAPCLIVFDGSHFERISTDGFDYLLESLKHPELSTAAMYRIDGHLIYHLTFFYVNPAIGEEDNITLIYDFNTKMFFDLTDQDMNYHPLRQAVHFSINNNSSAFVHQSQNQVYFISLNNGSLYRMSSDITVINENLPDYSPTAPPPDMRYIYPIRRIRRFDTIRFPDTKRFEVKTFFVTIEQGNSPFVDDGDVILMITENNIRIFSEMNPPSSGVLANVQIIPENSNPFNVTGNFEQPAIELRFSQDGGTNWSNAVRQNLNPIGLGRNILCWNQCGIQNEWTPELNFYGLGRFVAAGGLAKIR